MPRSKTQPDEIPTESPEAIRDAAFIATGHLFRGSPQAMAVFVAQPAYRAKADAIHQAVTAGDAVATRAAAEALYRFVRDKMQPKTRSKETTPHA